jgi:large subunit ribosomal protein L22
MKLSASAKFVRISPSKVRPFARLLKGMSIEEALTSAGFSSNKGSFFITKLLKSMVANLASNNLNESDYHIAQVKIEQGPSMKRFWPRSRGMARPIIKRTSHIRIELAENKEKRKE